MCYNEFWKKKKNLKLCSIRHPKWGYLLKKHSLMRFFYHTSTAEVFYIRLWSLYSDLYWKAIHNHENENSIADTFSILKVLAWNFVLKVNGTTTEFTDISVLLHCKFFRTVVAWLHVLHPSSSTNTYLACNK